MVIGEIELFNNTPPRADLLSTPSTQLLEKNNAVS